MDVQYATLCGHLTVASNIERLDQVFFVFTMVWDIEMFFCLDQLKTWNAVHKNKSARIYQKFVLRNFAVFLFGFMSYTVPVFGLNGSF